MLKKYYKIYIIIIIIKIKIFIYFIIFFFVVGWWLGGVDWLFNRLLHIYIVYIYVSFKNLYKEDSYKTIFFYFIVIIIIYRYIRFYKIELSAQKYHRCEIIIINIFNFTSLHI